MDTDKLIKKAEGFLKENECILWMPVTFPEDMTDEDALDTLESQGNDMYHRLREANGLIMSLTRELEYYMDISTEGEKQFSGWTAVSDALPECEKTVLVCNGEEPEDMWFCHRTLRKDVATDAQGWCNYPPQREITHWRYIEPLKKKSERKP